MHFSPITILGHFPTFGPARLRVKLRSDREPQSPLSAEERVATIPLAKGNLVLPGANGSHLLRRHLEKRKSEAMLNIDVLVTWIEGRALYLGM
jgi:hypothetical protein